jgi:NAD(P)-dependent dehydrogenase (short-subunit alcohol dehydrogenase family)
MNVGSRRWFITGASTGFGRVMARELVARGERVVGTVRNALQIQELAAEGISAVLLDITHRARIGPAFAEAEAMLDGIDVLVNNAGYGLMGAIEAFDEDQIRDVMEVNFFGPLALTRVALPKMRIGGGAMVFISSMAGIVGLGGAGAYCASKFALEGLAESLSDELKAFGVKVLIVEPSSFRTDFHGRSMHTTPNVIEAYRGSVAGDVNELLQTYNGSERGDPVKGVRAILEALDAPATPLRLAIGADAIAAIESKHSRLLDELAQWKDVGIATAADG